MDGLHHAALAVRTRLEGRREWATLDLGRIDSQNDGWFSGRYPGTTACSTVLVRLSAGEPAGVDPVALACS